MPEAFFLVCGDRVDFDLEKEVAGVGYAEVFDYAVAEMVRNVSHAALKEGGVELAVCQRHRGIAADQIVKLKKRLVADVVNGKIDVRDVEIPEYEFVDEDAGADSDSDDDSDDTEEQEE